MQGSVMLAQCGVELMIHFMDRIGCWNGVWLFVCARVLRVSKNPCMHSLNTNAFRLSVRLHRPGRLAERHGYFIRREVNSMTLAISPIIRL